MCEQGSCVAPAIASEGELPRRAKRRGKRHSTGMMVGGIVMVSVAPVAFLGALVSSMRKDSCQSEGSYGFGTPAPPSRDCSSYDTGIAVGVVLGAGLLAAGIPFIVIGAKREPLRTAVVAPWATAGGAGLSLGFDL